MTDALEIEKVALLSAKEVLEFVIRETESSLEFFKSQSENLQETLFVAIETADRPLEKQCFRDSSNNFIEFKNSQQLRQFLQRRVHRAEFEKSCLQDKYENLTIELAEIKSRLQTLQQQGA